MEHTTDTHSVNSEFCNERYRHFERELDNGKVRMDKHSETLDRLDRLITEMATLNRTSSETLQKHEERIGSLENRPGALWDKVISGVIAAAVAAFMAYVLK